MVTDRTWYAPFWVRKDDPHAAMVVQTNLVDLAKWFGKIPFFWQWNPRREDPYAAIIVQKNLDFLTKQL